MSKEETPPKKIINVLKRTSELRKQSDELLSLYNDFSETFKSLHDKTNDLKKKSKSIMARIKSLQKAEKKLQRRINALNKSQSGT